MRRGLISFVGVAVLLLSFAATGAAQIQPTTVAKVTTIQNPDGGAYTIVEYPVGKETIVTGTRCWCAAALLETARLS